MTALVLNMIVTSCCSKQEATSEKNLPHMNVLLFVSLRRNKETQLGRPSSDAAFTDSDNHPGQVDAFQGAKACLQTCHILQTHCIYKSCLDSPALAVE